MAPLPLEALLLVLLDRQGRLDPVGQLSALFREKTASLELEP